MFDNRFSPATSEKGVDDFIGDMTDTWTTTKVDNNTHEWAYTNSVQNEDDLFLFPPSARKTKPLRQFKERCQTAIDKLMRRHR